MLLITFGQAVVEQVKIRKEKELKRKADILRNNFTKLGEIADEVISLEEESGIWFEMAGERYYKNCYNY